ncbi:diguanylate cyclase/phosphodiesterase (GGDEF & EAL domains) with PAS/PAC sensor(s) [hydrothermal vent metagenome]|uniref:Diguanylate cyclase/phosphodiesterase (GGDEF & EAL domains) with PAS/PAC sensor(S) n=1 Tax=hydrothermal vent metagenome TaxID=652676 RepID=A0A3B1AET1_9ZZZZ
MNFKFPKLGLRFKLFLPLIFFSILFAAYAQYQWLPQFLSFVQEQEAKNINSHLHSVTEGLVPLLLENQLASVYDNLNTLLINNESWKNLILRDSNNIQLFPFKDITTINNKNSYHAVQDITYLGNTLGTLYLTVDNTNIVNIINMQQQFFLVALVLLLTLFSIAIVIVLEVVVRQPLHYLAIASDKIAQGDFNIDLPKQHHDEVGKLIHSFSLMRYSIRKYQSKLKVEINSHKKTADELFKEKERFSYHATHDALTGLINRHEFDRRLTTALARTKTDKSKHAILYLDLDQFKVVNDTCGHIAGDELLRQLTTLLKNKIRDRDTLARLGGDEFGVLLDFCQLNQAEQIAEVLRETIQDFRFSWNDNVFSIGASIGLVSIDENSDNLTNILSTADTACYIAKERGRNRIHVYEQGNAELEKRKGEMQWVPTITKALEDDRFKLFYQPIVPVNQHRKIPNHIEILLSMISEDGQQIPPGAFIPAAERFNLMESVDIWVIQNALEYIVKYNRAKPDNPMMFSVNLSGVSLSNDTVLAQIIDLIERFKLKPDTICFEITETAAIANLSNACTFIKELNQLGCQFSLDDFGSGLSSFAYLKNLPVNSIKIDGSFVKDINKDLMDFAFVKSINEIGHVMGMKTIAEFVENVSILKLLRDINVDLAQGFFIQRPTPLDELLQGHYNTSKVS